ncbi:trehalose-6-phosphate synthase [Nocardia sp. NPDC101769]|uniref:alpha,alpha-trehalose-phosphate synthase (UDP-forming) n=1 Tax=Nocardia sp. NPDC101769 TaxID=3364333 RepID=UPI0037FAFD69
MEWADHRWRAPASPNGVIPTLRALLAGTPQATWVAAAVDTDPTQLDHHGTGLPLSFLPLTRSDWSGYFHRCCKETLWPVLMSHPHLMRFDKTAWAQYQTVNARFADHINAVAAPGATVWLHDYNLWLVPGRLRRSRPDLRLGLFHHTPFPPPSIFATLPTAAEIRASVAGLHWAGFHTSSDAEHFRDILAGTAATTRLGVHPLGIDRTAVETIARARLPYRQPDTEKLVLSVERLDYTKAPVQKVDAVATLLARRPELAGRLRFRLVCPPPESGITAYDTTRNTLGHHVDQVNNQWRTTDWQPIDYLPHPLPLTEIIDHYLAADIFWITSLRDGMNLTAKEFIASHAACGLSGALILSRYAGAAAELGDAALLTDPHSPTDLVDTLEYALTLNPTQRNSRLTRLAHRLGHQHPTHWAAEIIAAIQHRSTLPGHHPA